MGLVQYCLPTDSPDFARTMRPFALAMSHLTWARHRPDRFDSYSCGTCSSHTGSCPGAASCGCRQGHGVKPAWQLWVGPGVKGAMSCRVPAAAGFPAMSECRCLGHGGYAWNMEAVLVAMSTEETSCSWQGNRLMQCRGATRPAHLLTQFAVQVS